jgi:hypothetical protein
MRDNGKPGAASAAYGRSVSAGNGRGVYDDEHPPGVRCQVLHKSPTCSWLRRFDALDRLRRAGGSCSSGAFCSAFPDSCGGEAARRSPDGQE